MSDKKFYDTIWFFLFVLAMGIGSGWMLGLMSGQMSEWQRRHVFDRCLEWKKDFDWCRKEFMP